MMMAQVDHRAVIVPSILVLMPTRQCQTVFLTVKLNASTCNASHASFFPILTAAVAGWRTHSVRQL